MRFTIGILAMAGALAGLGCGPTEPSAERAAQGDHASDRSGAEGGLGPGDRERGVQEWALQGDADASGRPELPAEWPPDLLPNQRAPLPGVATGGQPSDAQLAAARDAGFRTVVNLRSDDEPGTPAERAKVEALGMDYVWIPVEGADGLTPENVQALHETLSDESARPVLIHCASGNRVGALMALRALVYGGASPEEALEIGTEAGLAGLEPKVNDLLRP